MRSVMQVPICDEQPTMGDSSIEDFLKTAKKRGSKTVASGVRSRQCGRRASRIDRTRSPDRPRGGGAMDERIRALRETGRRKVRRETSSREMTRLWLSNSIHAAARFFF
jgi:hypothetical protein